MTQVRFGHAGPEDAEAVANVVGTAFCDLDVAKWLVPDPVERAKILPAQFVILAEHAIRYGTVLLTVERDAAAVWFPKDGTPIPPPRDYDARLATACGAWTDRFHTLDELFDAHHPAKPHQHLALLAVLPGRQGKGVGSALLRYRHEQLDAAGESAYLEASSLQSRALYLRHGYEPHGEPFAVPDGSQLWPMWREPR
ncbi:GNAT family N-acetyltransferase [Longispora albida]|uniref:GNAT family N-acetyltransferase n=1 Tax=Longispora albida TaxID=203523 RepID=UPI0003630F9F|nr:GNAT family N-acetyltransferase [Longispora albida]